MKAKIIKKIGPYDGPFERIITYKLKLENKHIITWHENGKRNFPNLQIYDIIKGLELKENGKLPNYKKSKISILNEQLSLL
tara:strand:- start:344 stop:586 length:243 start_codon:yes stop_codon:yes gene_type:complete